MNETFEQKNRYRIITLLKPISLFILSIIIFILGLIGIVDLYLNSILLLILSGIMLYIALWRYKRTRFLEKTNNNKFVITDKALLIPEGKFDVKSIYFTEVIRIEIETDINYKEIDMVTLFTNCNKYVFTDETFTSHSDYLKFQRLLKERCRWIRDIK